MVQSEVVDTQITPVPEKSQLQLARQTPLIMW